MEIISKLSHQIYNLQNSVHMMHSQLGQKEQDLRRLKKVQINLINDQDEFHRRVNTFQKPELSFQPWKGRLAEEFQMFRQGDLLSSYKEIATIQLDTALERLQQEITALEQSVNYLQGQIASSNASISDLKRRKREELS